MKSDLRARSRLLRILVDIVLAALLLVFAIPVIAVLRGLPLSPGMALDELPMFFYLWGIWNARQAIAAIGRGEMFGQVVPRLLGRVGLALFIGGLTKVFFGPWLISALGRGPTFAYFDVAAVTVGVVGATLIIVAQLLREAAKMREELDEFL